MSIEQLINKLFLSRGANRVELVSVHSLYDDITFRDTGTGRTYSISKDDSESWKVFEVVDYNENDDELATTSFSKYIEGLLSGKTRNDAGELV